MTSHRNYLFHRILALLLAVWAVALSSSAQTDAQLTHYFEVPNYYNPAAIGTTDYIKIRGGARLQWIGIDNAPTTLLLTGNMPLKLFGKRFGVGLVAQTESMGLYKNITVGLQLGYKFKLWKGEFTVALQPGVFNEAFKGSKVFIPDDDDFHTSTDEAIPTNDVAGTVFDLGIGAWYVHPKFYAGLSLTHAMSPTVTFSADSGSGESASEAETGKKFQFQALRSLYFIGGSNIPIKNTLFEVMPSVMVMSDFTFTTGQATVRARYNKFLTAGIGYRYDDAISAMLAVEFKGFYLGYSFDYSLHSAIAKASSGSHEIFAGYQLKLNLGEKNKNKHKSIRLM